MRIHNLAIEFTRRCNIACDFCLRGDSQNKNIPLEYIDILLNQVSSIGHFCPTGGEPSLNLNAIEFFINGCIERNITIDSFYIATNGINITHRFVDVCLKLYNLCKFGYLCHVQISNDIYHNNQKMYDETLFDLLPFYSKKHVDGYTLDDGKKIHREGRFANNENAKIKSAAKTVTSISVFNNNPIYLNVNGEIINGCDWSYENQKNNILCDVASLEEFTKNLAVI